MGQSFSSGNAVYVLVDKKFYHAGDVVNGEVLVNCVSEFECKELELKLEGEQEVSWEEKRDNSSYDNDAEEWTTSEEYFPFTGGKEFFKVKQKIAGAMHMVPGQYQYPFQFRLPTGLPGTFKYEDSQNMYAGTYYNYTKAEVKYELEAEMKVEGTLKDSKLKHEAKVVVHQQLQKKPTEVKAENTQSVTGCCCAPQGSATVAAVVDKDSYAAGEVASVLLEIENNSDAEFKSVVVKLQRTVTLTAGGNIQKQDDTVLEQSFEGIKPQTMAKGKDARSLAVNLPSSLLPSTNGDAIDCDYELMVCLKSLSSLVSDVELKVPLLIYVPAPSDEPAIGAPGEGPPPWWNPATIAPMVKMEVPSAPPLPPKTQEMTDYAAPQPVYSGQQ